MREIKFRQPILKPDGSFDHFHYWGILEDSFVGRDCSGNKKGDDQEYTGRKDKNRKELYEGDIIKGSFAKTATWQIVFIDAMFAMQMIQNLDIRQPLKYTELDWEIIGNICENPELLKEAN